MAVDTHLALLELAGSIAERAKKALGKIVKKDGTLRDIEQIRRLDRALKLFNDNLLGEVHTYVSEPEKKIELNKEIQKRRAAFRKKIDQWGEEKIEKNFVQFNEMPARVRHLIVGHRFNHSQRCPLRKLVRYNEKDILGNIGMGKLSLPFFARALANEGLSLGMSEREVEECFGPESVRIVIYLKSLRTREDVGTGVEIIIEGSDGQLYRSFTCANGAHFALPPGECRILRPKLYSPNSKDGRERIFLQTRIQFEAYTFYMVV